MVEDRGRDAAALWRRRVRLASGLWLLAFVTGHLINHALGLVSLEAMERGRLAFLAFWRLPPVEASLLLALLAHAGLGLHRLWRRRTLRMGGIDALQLALGLAVPMFLVVHLLATGVLVRCCGVNDSYAYVLNSLWPERAGRQSLFLLLVWAHGCVGVHLWLRQRGWYGAAVPWLLPVTVLLPTLALLGFVEGGRELRAELAADPARLDQLAAAQRWPDVATIQGVVVRGERWIVGAFVLLLTGLLGGRLVRGWIDRSRRVRVRYDGNVEITVPTGLTLLEASRIAGVPHASVCGGRGRCSTCRVRLIEGGETLPPPDAAEKRLLERIGAPPDVRLACQLPVRGSLRVVRLVPPPDAARHVLRRVDPAIGREQELAVLFADLRGFTRLAEGGLPWDTVHILNRWFAESGRAIQAAGGRVDKYLGDGVMALFGLEGPPERAALEGLRAAAGIARALARLNRELATDLREPLRVGIGLHLGTAIVGEIGWGHAVGLTAIGDTVNVASRLEQLTKQFGCQLVVSEAVAARAGAELGEATLREVSLRGRDQPLRVHAVIDAALLPLPADAISSAASSTAGVRP